MVSVVESELFLMPSILPSARAVMGGAMTLLKRKPAIADAPASAVPARNFLRFRYRLFGVISDEAVFPDFLINMKISHTKYGSSPPPDCGYPTPTDWSTNGVKTLHPSAGQRILPLS